MATDAACMALLAASADKSGEAGTAKRIDTAVTIIQQFALFGENRFKLAKSATKSRNRQFDAKEVSA